MRALAAGDGRSCAITADGRVSCWGQSYSGAIDWSHRIAAPIPGLEEVIAIAVTHEHGCALRADHTLRCFGYNRFGELGDGTRTENLTPVGAALVKWR